MLDNRGDATGTEVAREIAERFTDMALAMVHHARAEVARCRGDWATAA